MTYQDKWAKGKLVWRGERECESRYQVVKYFCHINFRHLESFTVCDIGANMNYFGIRLTEDFPNCHVMSFEFHEFKMRQNHLKMSGAERILFLDRKLSLLDLASLGTLCQFDLVLALSVLHHVRSGKFSDWVSAIRGLGRYTIAEFAMDDSSRAASRKGYSVPSDGLQIGAGLSHLTKGVHRPIILLKGAA